MRLFVANVLCDECGCQMKEMDVSPSMVIKCVNCGKSLDVEYQEEEDCFLYKDDKHY